MKIKSAKDIKPLRDSVIVQVTKIQEDDLIISQTSTKQHVNMVFGEVVSTGPETNQEENCPGVACGDSVMFSEFAGQHISTESDKLEKVVRGYDIMVKLDNINEITKDNITAVSDRVIVSVFYRDETVDGIVLSEDNSKDPTLQDLDYGQIISIGASCKTDLKEGQIVAYGSGDYVGECIAKQPEKDVAEYRAINEKDILFTL